MKTINKRFLPNIADQLFGMGLGNCDYATGINVITLPFFLKVWLFTLCLDIYDVYVFRKWMDMI
jgi:hypothetical protein